MDFLNPCTFHQLSAAETFLSLCMSPVFLCVACCSPCALLQGVHFWCITAGCAFVVHFRRVCFLCAFLLHDVHFFVHFCRVCTFSAFLLWGVHFLCTSAFLQGVLFVCTSAAGCALPTILGVAVLLAWGPLPALTSLSRGKKGRGKLFCDKEVISTVLKLHPEISNTTSSHFKYNIAARATSI